MNCLIKNLNPNGARKPIHNWENHERKQQIAADEDSPVKTGFKIPVVARHGNHKKYNIKYIAYVHCSVKKAHFSLKLYVTLGAILVHNRHFAERIWVF